MTRFITAQETDRLRKAPQDSFQARLYAALKARTLRNTVHPGFVQPDDTQEWWHLCWERASDAAFVWHMERDDHLGQWIRGVAFDMRDAEDTEWIGPWFRNHDRPLTGQLETAHVTWAMCEILDLCQDLFTAEERAGLEAALREKGMEPCLRFCEKVQGDHRHISNWFSVLTSGYGAAAMYLQDEKAIRRTLNLLQDAYGMYNRDSYGESVQYSNYCSLTMAQLHEILLRLRPDLAAQVSLAPYANLMDWYAASFLYMKPWDDEVLYPRTLNFADSAAVFRPTGNVLAQVAVRLKENMPRQAALASWLLETAYARPEEGADELATFGFYNHFSYHTVLMQPDMAPARSPAELGMSEKLAFENGHVILRDSWQKTRSVLGVQAGYQTMNVTGHRHQDHGSFQFAQGTERMIVDGGHCCYRLQDYRYSCSSSQHAVFDFVREAESTNAWWTVIDQKKADGSFYSPKPPRVRNLISRYAGPAHVLTMDLTDAYGDEVTLAQRCIVSCLPGAVFIIDRAETAEPLRMRTHFPMNNRDDELKIHQADDHRFVFRRHGEAMKVFECAAFMDGEQRPSEMRFGWGFAHRNYHPLANQDGQGKEGSVMIYNWVDAQPATSHLRLCAIASDVDERIKGWHIKPEGENRWYIENPEKQKLLVVEKRGNSAWLIQPDGETQIL